jgi:hypothetical protein
MALCLGACSESNNDEPDGPVKPDPVVPDPTNPEKPSYPTLTESEASADLAELMVRCMVLGADPTAECNDFGRLWELMETIYHQPETRGVWSAATSVFKFKQALDNSRALYRAALLGAMVETDQLGPDARKSIWRSIMDAPPYGEGLTKMSLPNEYRVGCEDFWKSFSLGEFDDASVFIFTAVTSHFNDSDKTPAQVVAEYLYDHNMREIDMMLTCAGPIIEQGCNVVFAAGGDLISWGQTAYDYVEKNGQVILQKCKGNLTGETYADAFNTNLKILIGGLEEIYPQSGDLAGVLADFTTDQIKAFNKALHEALTTAGATTLSPEDVTWFVSQVQDIVGFKKEPTFLNQAYFCKDDMSQLTIEGTQGHSYQFYYTDRHGNVLMEGMCAVDNKYISVRVDETSLNPSCDLLPQEGLSMGGIVNIPYYVMNEGTLVLWYQTRNHSSIYFSIMNDELTESLFDELTLNMFVTGKMEDGSETKVLRATKSNGAVFGKDDISTSYFGDGLWVRGVKDFKTSSGTTIRHKIEFLLESNNIFDLSNAQRFSYSYDEHDKNGKPLSWWSVFSPVIPLDQDDQEKAVWLAEESKGNMRVTNLTCRENYKTVCNQYASNPGTNRIEINVLKGEMPAQLEVSPKLLEFEAEGGEQSITVKKGYFQLSNCFWEDNQQWGWSKQFDNDTTIIVKVPENTTTEERTTKLIVWAANKSFDQIDMEKDVCDTTVVVIRQKGKEPTHLEVSPKLLEFEAEGGTKSITAKKVGYKKMGFLWKETPEWGQTVAIEGEDKIRVSLPENTTSKEREAKLIVWAANKDYNELDMQKDKCDTTVVVIKQKGKKEFHVPDISRIKIRFVLSLKDDSFTSDEKRLERHDLINGFNAEIKTERSGNGYRVTAKLKETDSTYDISFVVNGYDGEKTTQDSYVSDLKYRWEYKTEYWKWTKEFSAERVEYKNFEQYHWSGDTGYRGWAAFSFYSEGPNLNITSYYEQSDDDWDDSHWGYSTSDLNIKSTDFIELIAEGEQT